MAWADEKAKLKSMVHDTFALPATYTRALGGAGISLSVRLNNDVRLLGGEGLRGFMQAVQDVPKLRIRKSDLSGVRPGIQDSIAIPSEGITATINNINPDDGEFYVVEVEILA